jgi:hypothetical protein
VVADLQLLGFHGIWQAWTDPQVLEREWNEAARRGMLIATECGASLETASRIRVPHYGRLLLAGSSSGWLSGASDELDVVNSEDFVELLEETLVELVTGLSPTEQAELEARGETLGFPGLPRRVNRLLAILEARWPKSAEYIIGMLREVSAYLGDQTCRDAVVELLAKEIPEGCQGYLGHSLGSVVAVDAVLRGRLQPPALLITAGSPLAWGSVRRRIRIEDEWGSGEAAPMLKIRWLNVYDPHDPVCAGRGIPPMPGAEVENLEVLNPVLEAHKAVNYIGQGGVQSWIANARPPKEDWL